METDLRQTPSAISHHTSYPCCIPQDAGVFSLSQHLVQGAFEDLQTVELQHIRLQGGTLRITDGWQLGMVANEQQTTIAAVIYKTDEVVE